MQKKRNVLLLGIVSFINDVGSKMILPILPLFIFQVGGGGLAVGLIAGIGESVASILKVVSGFWSDTLGKRKPFVVWGYALSSLAKYLLYLAQSWPMVLVLRAGERAGKGLRSAPRDAMLAASGKKRGRTFGIHRAFDSGGAVIGAVVTFLLFWYLDVGLRTIFLLAGIISFFSMVPLMFTTETATGKAAKKFIGSFRQLSKKLKLFIVVATIFSLGNFTYMFFVLKASTAFAAKQAIGIPILLYILYMFVYTLFAVPSGLLADKIGKDKVLLLGYALFGVIMLGFILFSSLTAFIILFILYGLMFALVESNQRAYVSDLSKKEIRGTALGTFFTATSFAALPAGLIAGLLWDVTPTLTFGYGLVTSVAAVLIFLFVRRI